MLPEPRYADWRPVAVRRWATSWVGFLSGAFLVLLYWVVTRTFSFGAFLGAALVSRFVTARLVAKQLADLRDDPEGGQFAATMRVAREVPYGFDEGLLAFDNGWLVYSGRRCAFSLPASAVKIRTVDKSTLAFAFGPSHDERTVYLNVENSDRYCSEATQWRDAQKVEGDSIVYPPLAPDATGFAAVRSLGGMSFAFTAIVLTIMVLSPSKRPYVSLGVLLIGSVGVAIYVFESMHSLRRLDKGLPRQLPLWRRAFVPAKHRDALPSHIKNQ